MIKDDIITLFNYNHWANGRVLDAASKVSQVQFVAPAKVSHGSLRGALVHVLSAEWVWRQRCQEGLSPPALLAEASFPTLADLRAHWRAEERTWDAYLKALGERELNGVIRYTNTSGRTFETVLWHILAHVVNHGTQFRSEAAVVLTDYGHSPGDLDLILYLRQG